MKPKKKERKKVKPQSETAPNDARSSENSGRTQGQDNGGMDFGGLPERDLKKNLGGCG